MNYGWHRSEILGAFISVMSIWIVTGVLVYLAIERIVRNDYEIEAIEFNSVKEVLLSVKAVKSMHCLHLWSLTLGQSLVSVHLAIEEGSDPQAVLQEATDLLYTKFGFHSVTIQVELYLEEMSHCFRCQDPRD
uniref:Solute carrier family 30 (Zinc transporter), member 2 n=1 Tax=Nothobranchius furzeri TaxID=105023 RepID=A0A1A8VF09_NOTFU